MFSLNCLLMNSQTLVFSIFVYVQQGENLAYEVQLPAGIPTILLLITQSNFLMPSN